MRLVQELISQLRLRGDEVSLEAASKIERQAELLSTQYSHEQQTYKQLEKEVKKVIRDYDNSSSSLQESIDNLREEINDEH